MKGNVVWNTEYRQQLNERARWESEEWYRLNHFLKYLLLIDLMLNICFGVTIWLDETNEMFPLSFKVLTTLFTLLNVVGIWAVLQLHKIGFYIVVIPRLLLSVILLFFPLEMVGESALTCFLDTIFFVSALLLNNRCMINAYDLLWASDDAVRPINYLEEELEKDKEMQTVG